MKANEQFFGIKERIYELNKQEIVQACLDYIRKSSDFKRPIHELITKTSWHFQNEDGFEINEDVGNFLYVETYKQEKEKDK
jgi:hypothetical protein